MDEEIDLREIVNSLIAHWFWIVGLALIAAAIAFVGSVAAPKKYTSSALVLVTDPTYQILFDPRFETLPEAETATRALPDLAESSDVLLGVLDTLEPPLPVEKNNLDYLQGKLQAGLGTDPSVINLTAVSRNPEESAQLANTWAVVFVDRANDLYGESTDEVAQFEIQLAEVDAQLDRAEQDLIAFQQQNMAGILNARLGTLLAAQGTYVSEWDNTNRMVRNVESLNSRMAALPAGEEADLGDDLTAMLLEIKSFDAQSVASEAFAIQLQVGQETSATRRTNEDLVRFLTNMSDILGAKSQNLVIEMESLEAEILDLQGQIQELQTEETRLVRARDLAEETQKTMARKVEEAHIRAQGMDGNIKIASRASVPVIPAYPRTWFNICIAGAAGLILGTVVVLVRQYWYMETPGAKNGPVGGPPGGKSYGK